MEDRTGDPGKGVTRAKGKMRETMMDGLEAGREGGTEETGTSSGVLCTLRLPAPFLPPHQVSVPFPAAARIQWTLWKESKDRPHQHKALPPTSKSLTQVGTPPL